MLSSFAEGGGVFSSLAGDSSSAGGWESVDAGADVPGVEPLDNQGLHAGSVQRFSSRAQLSLQAASEQALKQGPNVALHDSDAALQASEFPEIWASTARVWNLSSRRANANAKTRAARTSLGKVFNPR